MMIEDILQQPMDKYSFCLREYISPNAEYYLEAVVFYPVVSDTIGIIIEEDCFNAALSYSESEMLATFARLEEKSRRIIKILQKASIDYNHNYAGGGSKN